MIRDRKLMAPAFSPIFRNPEKHSHNTDQSDSYLHTGSCRIKNSIDNGLKYFCISKKDQSDECCNKRDQKKK